MGSSGSLIMVKTAFRWFVKVRDKNADGITWVYPEMDDSTHMGTECEGDRSGAGGGCKKSPDSSTMTDHVRRSTQWFDTDLGMIAAAIASILFSLLMAAAMVVYDGSKLPVWYCEAHATG